MSIIPSIYNENAVMCVFNVNSKKFSFTNLGLSDWPISHLKALSNLESGLLLVAGPTSISKTTTIYSLLKYLSFPTKKVVTIEDLIEYRESRWRQDSSNVEPHPVNCLVAGCQRDIQRWNTEFRDSVIGRINVIDSEAQTFDRLLPAFRNLPGSNEVEM
jgi:hypothetical protein